MTVRVRITILCHTQKTSSSLKNYKKNYFDNVTVGKLLTCKHCKVFLQQYDSNKHICNNNTNRNL